MDAKEVGQRFKDLRRYLDYDSGQKFGNEIGTTKQTISAIESTGEGLTRDRIQLICDKWGIDARYFFGQLDTPEEADMKKRGEDPGKSRIEALMERIRDMQEQMKFLRPQTKMSPEAERVMQNAELGDLVKQIMFWDANALRAFKTMAMGFFMGRTYEKDSAGDQPPSRESAG